MMDIKEVLLRWFIYVFDKQSTLLPDKSTKSSGIAMLYNEQLVEELQKPIIKKILKRRIYSLFKDNIWGAD